MAAAQISSVEVVELLYAKGSISPDVVEAAFSHAVGDNCSDVTTFLATQEYSRTTRFVPY